MGEEYDLCPWCGELTPNEETEKHPCILAFYDGKRAAERELRGELEAELRSHKIEAKVEDEFGSE